MRVTFGWTSEKLPRLQLKSGRPESSVTSRPRRPRKAHKKKKKDAQPTAEILGDVLDKSCLYSWLMSEDEDKIKIRKVLSGVEFQKFENMWAKG